MTFSFVLDAFPDYTKFKKTKKVLAALQVITEAVDTADEQREACAPVNVEAKAGVNISFNDTGTKGLVKVIAEGNYIDGKAEDSYDRDVFGDLTSKGEFAEVTLQFNDIESTKEYTVIQDNPALAVAYPNGGGGIEGENKTKPYAGSELMEGYSLLLSEKAGPISVKVKDSNGNILQTIQITNKVSFVKRVKVTIMDADEKIDPDSYAVNETTVSSFTNVISGDTICFKAKADATVSTVKANGRRINKDATGTYRVVVNGDTNIVVS